MEPGWCCSGHGTDVAALEGLEVHPVGAAPLWGPAEAWSSLLLTVGVPAVGTQVQSPAVTSPVTLSRYRRVAGLGVLGGCPCRQSPGALSSPGSAPPVQLPSLGPSKPRICIYPPLYPEEHWEGPHLENEALLGQGRPGFPGG